MKDGGLRPLFRHKFKTWQWSSIETAGTASGVPDCEYCSPEGTAGWIEFKKTDIFYVQIKPLQVSWLMKRCRYGGNAFIGVRRITWKPIYTDDLYLMRGDQAEPLFYEGLKGTLAMKWSGGPNEWNYNEISAILNLRDRFWEQA